LVVTTLHVDVIENPRYSLQILLLWAEPPDLLVAVAGGHVAAPLFETRSLNRLGGWGRYTQVVAAQEWLQLLQKHQSQGDLVLFFELIEGGVLDFFDI